ncbi:MAG TPA: hypothetical protein VG899_01705 [Mycobacteriales bacterium]|nr:hypothetical protein [Mycobacteriales bacterium]HWA65071.1 hypothetical protein [Mycobacteriales bacterium]
MNKLLTATITAGLLAGAAALPATASAAPHAAAKHQPAAVTQAPCGKGLGIDLALGSFNLCIPL